VQIILLDTRFFRSPLRRSERPMEPGWERYMPYPPGADVTMLGEDQWAWLAAELRKPADIRLICSSIQVIAEGHGWERWGNMPDEQARLYRLLADTGARGVVILSGDRHHGSIHRITIPSQPDLLELTASGVNTPSSHVRDDGISPRETSATRIGPGYAPIHFGRVNLDWTARTLSLQLLGDRGQEIQNVQVPFARVGLG
jgi:alkaline phosphatase D